MGATTGPGRADDLFLGIDFGTSGCRAVAIDTGGKLLAQAETPFGAGAAADPAQWWQALVRVLKDLRAAVDYKKVRALAVDGTSATLLLCDTQGQPLTPALFYNDSRALAQAARIAARAPQQAAVHGPTSSLAKLLWFQDNGLADGIEARAARPGRRDCGLAGQAAHALHQADWIAGRLTGAYGHSDYHNCLKLGYDAERRAWPTWLTDLGVNTALLPQVHTPGESLGQLHPDVAALLGLPPETQVRAGTTDGVAAFLAAGAHAPGHGVTSLGSTLVLKLVSDRPVFSPTHGVYSHRLGDRWLTGGASNSGGAVLAQYFSAEELLALTPLLKPDVPTGLDYYPLPSTGERFPVNNPALAPRLSPRPADRVVFLQGLLEGIARIEARGYELLAALGAPPLTALWTSGGGAQNLAWERLRAHRLKVPLHTARSDLAAYGSARLAAGLHENQPL
ncbi:MAG: FGGY-family carbohydrate kinase [Gammaproteobacteria bacterium]|nr:FGGY-family carbohydrate kinase [Gammaproteobacteria bacterium]